VGPRSPARVVALDGHQVDDVVPPVTRVALTQQKSPALAVEDEGEQRLPEVPWPRLAGGVLPALRYQPSHQRCLKAVHDVVDRSRRRRALGRRGPGGPRAPRRSPCAGWWCGPRRRSRRGRRAPPRPSRRARDSPGTSRRVDEPARQVRRSVWLQASGVGGEPGDFLWSLPAATSARLTCSSTAPQAGAHRHPDLLEVHGGALVVGRLGPEAAHLGKWGRQAPDHVGQLDVAARGGPAGSRLRPLAGSPQAPTGAGRRGRTEKARGACRGELLGRLGAPATGQAEEGAYA